MLTIQQFYHEILKINPCLERNMYHDHRIKNHNNYNVKTNRKC